MHEKNYYIEYLKRTDRFPQSVYHKAKHHMVQKMFDGLLPYSVVLDAGCGTGHITGRYCNSHTVIGVDEQISAIQYCRQTYGGSYIQANLDRLPFSDNHFDLILFLDVIEHLEQPLPALRELARVLKPGAKILICTINYASPLWFILENTWHRFFGGGCKPYSAEVHPSRYNAKMLRRHCNDFFNEIGLQKRVMDMELFYIGQKHKLEPAVCGHGDRKEIYKFDAVSLYKCMECGLIFNDKFRKDFSATLRYRDYYRNTIPVRFGFGIEYIIRLFRFFRAFKLFTIYPRAKSILDIGSGRGFLLWYLKKYYGYKRTAGVQISPNAFRFSRDKLGLEIYDKDLLELGLDNGNFDIITMWHVLEHLTDPDIYINKIYGLLNNSGKLAIEVPNFNSWTRGFTKKYWLGLDPDYHITYFTPESLSSLLEKHNFKVETVHTFSLEYSVFISAQSIISLLTRSDHLFFRWLQRPVFDIRLIPHILLFMLLMPFSLLINLLLYFSKKGEVLLIVACKELKKDAANNSGS